MTPELEAVGLVSARLLLAFVFALAGAAKLLDRTGTREALIAFGVRDRFAAPLVLALPAAELAIAAALLVDASTWPGALGALLLSAIFATGIGVNLARGRRPSCHCFGNLHSRPIGPSTLLFNGGIMLVAGALFWRARENPGPSLFAWMSALTPEELVGLALGFVTIALLVAIAALLWQVLAQQGRLLLRLDALEERLGIRAGVERRGLPLGAEAPAFELPNLEGETVSLASLQSRALPILLFFTQPQCGPCRSLLPEIARWRRLYEARLTIVLVSEGSVEDNLTGLPREAGDVLLQRKRETADAYGAWGTPAAILLEDGKIASATALGAEAIHRFMESLSAKVSPAHARDDPGSDSVARLAANGH
jgi:peroxiredoxin